MLIPFHPASLPYGPLTLCGPGALVTGRVHFPTGGSSDRWLADALTAAAGCGHHRCRHHGLALVLVLRRTVNMTVTTTMTMTRAMVIMMVKTVVFVKMISMAIAATTVNVCIPQ